jgi:putative transposase
VIEILVQRYCNARAAKRFFRKLLKGQMSTPWQLVTDKLKSYGAAHRVTMPSVNHTTARYENNRAEVSHQPTRQRERQMRRFKSVGQTQRFLLVHAVILNFFRFSRRRMCAENYRWLRARAFKDWSAATAA